MYNIIYDNYFSYSLCSALRFSHIFFMIFGHVCMYNYIIVYVYLRAFPAKCFIIYVIIWRNVFMYSFAYPCIICLKTMIKIWFTHVKNESRRYKMPR